MDFARDLWLRLETINAVTYFDEGSHAAAKALGMVDNGIAEVQVELVQEEVIAENAPTTNRQ